MDRLINLHNYYKKLSEKVDEGIKSAMKARDKETLVYEINVLKKPTFSEVNHALLL